MQPSNQQVLLFIEVFANLVIHSSKCYSCIISFKLITHDVGTFTFLGLQMRNLRLKEVKEVPEV